MSYDFLMMKPKGQVHSQHDLGEETLFKQDPKAIVEDLSALLPGVRWSRSNDGGWFGSFDGTDGFYEFRIGPDADYVWTLHTSHGAATRSLVATLYKALGLVAFDGQAMIIITPDGQIPA
jgi:hypothetical protein